MQFLHVKNGLRAARAVDQVGSDRPSNAGMFSVLVDRVESGRAPIDRIVAEHNVALSISTDYTLLLSQLPVWPHYKADDPKIASSFAGAP